MKQGSGFAVLIFNARKVRRGALGIRALGIRALGIRALGIRALGIRALLVAAFTAVALSASQSARAQSAVDHRLFDALLRRHVVNGFVDYDAFGRAPEFGQYLTMLDRVHPERLGEDERLAYWLNVYNAFTIQLIVAHHETESIRNINKALGVLQLKGPWSEPIVRAAGRRMSLDELNHSIIRKEFGEPRTHFAVVCAAIGCPPLRSEAYTGAKLLEQLDDQTRRFLHESPTKNRFERRVLYLSPIIRAYHADFGPTPTLQGVARALAPYYTGADKASLLNGRIFVRETSFDWTLNSQAKAKVRGLM